VGAGLLFASFRHVLAVDPGFRPAGVITAKISAPATRYADDAALRALASRALDRLRVLPAVAAAGLTNSIPFGGDFNDSVILAEGYQMAPGESLVSPYQIVASDGFFEAMKVRLVRGRLFEPRDTDSSTPVVIVDERMARKFWPGANPVGKRMFRPQGSQDVLKPTATTRFLTVIGVVREIKLASASAMGRGLESQLYGVRPMDPGIVSLVAVLLGLVALTACLVPALRAARVSPVQALTEL
jgi:putative ABC transport system permease protein